MLEDPDESRTATSQPGDFANAQTRDDPEQDNFGLFRRQRGDDASGLCVANDCIERFSLRVGRRSNALQQVSVGKRLGRPSAGVAEVI